MTMPNTTNIDRTPTMTWWGTTTVWCGAAIAAGVQDGLNALNGKHINTAFDVIGYPDSQMKVDHNTVYVWGHSRSSTINMPQTSYHSGFAGNTYYSGTTRYNQPTTIHAMAQIKIIANNAGYIQKWETYGNEFGFQRYAASLKQYAESQKKKDLEYEQWLNE